MCVVVCGVVDSVFGSSGQCVWCSGQCVWYVNLWRRVTYHYLGVAWV